MACDLPLPCLGCGADLQDRAGDRRVITSPASRKIVPVWEDLLNQKLEEIGKILDVEAVKPAYICRKCFCSYERFQRHKATLLASIESAISQMPTVNRDNSTRAGEVTPESARGGAVRSRKRGGEEDQGQRACQPKRALIQPPDVEHSPAVMVHVGYKNPRSYKLTPSRKLLGKHVARGNKLSIARDCMKDPILRKHIAKKMGNVLRQELAHIHVCASKVLQGNPHSKLTLFTWDVLLAHMEQHAPTLLELLKICTKKRGPQKENKAVIGLCTAILCKHLQRTMSIVQKILSLILYAGHCSKKVFVRLQKLSLTMSHKTVINMLDDLGKDYDKQLLDWRDKLHTRQTSTCMTPIAHLPQENDENDSTENGESADSGESTESDDGSESADDCQSTDNGESGSSDEACMMTSSESEDEPLQPLSTEYQPECLKSPSELQQISTSSKELLASDSPLSPSNETQGENSHVPGSDPLSMDSSEYPTFKIVGDNVDKSVKPRFMRYDSQSKSLHYFNHYAVKDRIDISHLSDIPPSLPSMDYLNLAESLLPSSQDNETLANNFSIHISRILTSNMPFFKKAERTVVRHIPHKYSKEMSQKSMVVPLGVLLKNENKKEDMISIMKTLHTYVPTKHYQKEHHMPTTDEREETDEFLFHHILFGGDQLTCARVRGSHKARVSEETDRDRLLGLVPVAEDWHTKVCLLEVIWKQLYKDGSAGEHGTLYQLRNLIHRRSVVKCPKNDVNSCEDFFLNVVAAHILAAAMQILDMDSLEAVPSSDLISDDYLIESAELRHSALLSVCRALISKFVDFKFLTTPLTKPKTQQADTVLSYACHVWSLGLFYIEYLDAIHEGDGSRVQRCWRYLLPIFKATRRKNYSLEALYMLYQCQYGLPPRLSHQVLWSRFVNTRGLPGHNIPCDLFNEHLNRLCKEAVVSLRANQTGNAVVRVSRAIGTLYPVMKQFDLDNCVPTSSGAHFKPSSEKDRNMLLEEIAKRVHVFKYTPGRKHKSFTNIKPLLQHKPQDLMRWMMGHIAKLAMSQCSCLHN